MVLLNGSFLREENLINLEYQGDKQFDESGFDHTSKEWEKTCNVFFKDAITYICIQNRKCKQLIF